MKRLVIIPGLVIAVAGLLLGAMPAGADPSGGGCQLAGNAAFAPGLSTASKHFTYSFGGKLTGCESSVSGAPAAGNVSAGQVYLVKGQKFQEPRASGDGSCANGTTAGTAIIAWAGGKITVIKYTTTSVTGGVLLQGTVQKSVTLPAIAPQVGQPKSTIVRTTLYSNASAQGLLTFQPPDPTLCASTGARSAAISGATTLDAQS